MLPKSTRFAVLIAVATAALWFGASAPAHAAVATPLPGTPVLFEAGWENAINLGALGYTQTEYTVEGTATAYTAATPLPADGRYSVTPAATAQFKTRMLVRRPADPAKSNGTILFEWLNVTNGFDWDPDWVSLHDELIRDGYTWVGVSAQRGGMQDLVTRFPARYGSLVHPGDSFSYDIFSQSALLFRSATASAELLGGAPVRTLIGGGHSQSGFRMVTFTDAIQPRDHSFDAIMIHGRGANGAALSQSPQATINVPANTQIRTDLDIPVIGVQAETEIGGSFNSQNARQPDSALYRLWEVPGTSHNDAYQAETHLGPACGSVPANSGQGHYVVAAALEGLRKWAQTGVAPASQPRVSLRSVSPLQLDTDIDGNLRGGVRTPALDVPTSTLTGNGNCGFFGLTIPFTKARLDFLYPTHGVYVSNVARALAAAVAQGTILPADQAEILNAAKAADVGQAFPSDTTNPTVTIASPVNNAVFVQGAQVSVSATCADSGSGIADCSVPAVLDTGRLGLGSFSVTAYDNAGNSTTVTRSYTVIAVTGQVGGTLAPTLSVTLGAPASLAGFVLGVARDYSAVMDAEVLSSAGDAALSVADSSSVAPGHLVNGAYALPQALQIAASSPSATGSTLAPLSASPLTLLNYAGPVTHDAVAIAFKQSIGANDVLRTGSYAKTLTFTLSTTAP
jgi:hypothetical protein